MLRRAQLQRPVADDRLNGRTKIELDGQPAVERLAVCGFTGERGDLLRELACTLFIAAGLAHRLHDEVVQRRDVPRLRRERQVK